MSEATRDIDSDQRHGFVLANGVYKTLDNLKGNDNQNGTSLIDINGSGVIVGWYYEKEGIGHSFIYVNGVFKEIATPNTNYNARIWYQWLWRCDWYHPLQLGRLHVVHGTRPMNRSSAAPKVVSDLPQPHPVAKQGDRERIAGSKGNLLQSAQLQTRDPSNVMVKMCFPAFRSSSAEIP